MQENGQLNNYESNIYIKYHMHLSFFYFQVIKKTSFISSKRPVISPKKTSYISSKIPVLPHQKDQWYLIKKTSYASLKFPNLQKDTLQIFKRKQLQKTSYASLKPQVMPPQKDQFQIPNKIQFKVLKKTSSNSSKRPVPTPQKKQFIVLIILKDPFFKDKYDMFLRAKIGP